MCWTVEMFVVCCNHYGSPIITFDRSIRIVPGTLSRDTVKEFSSNSVTQFAFNFLSSLHYPDLSILSTSNWVSSFELSDRHYFC